MAQGLKQLFLTHDINSSEFNMNDHIQTSLNYKLFWVAKGHFEDEIGVYCTEAALNRFPVIPFFRYRRAAPWIKKIW